MKESSDRELYRNLVCIWDEGSQQIVGTQWVIPESGIYHIKVGDESYIGRSENLFSRIQDHINGIFKNGYLGSDKVRRKFQQVRSLSIYVICEAPASELDKLERYYIDKYKPTLNRQLVAGSNGFEPITTKISPKNSYRLQMCKIRGYDGVKFHSKGEAISAILDMFFEENGEPEGMECYRECSRDKKGTSRDG